MFGDSWFWSPFMIPIVAIIGGISVAIVNSINRSRIRELEIRERIAMIERGMVPSPEADPNGFEKRMHVVEQVQQRHSGASGKFRAGGIMVMSVGFGLMLLISSSGETSAGIGVGGFLVIIGLGLLVNGFFASSQPPAPPSGSASVSDRPSDLR